MAAGVAARNRQIRQETLREFLSKQKLVEHVFDLAKKIEGLEPEVHELESGKVVALNETAEFALKKYKAAADLNLKLINKYLPDVKQVEIEQTIRDDRADTLTDADLAHIAASGSAGASESKGSKRKVH